MPKLLSQEEVVDIAAKMAEAYGLSPATVVDTLNSSWGVLVEIFRTIKFRRKVAFLPVKYTKTIHAKVQSFYASDYEDALTRLETELNRLNGRTSVAEHYREKFALEGADKVLESILQESEVPK